MIEKIKEVLGFIIRIPILVLGTVLAIGLLIVVLMLKDEEDG